MTAHTHEPVREPDDTTARLDFQALLDALPAWIAVVDASGTVVAVNAAWQRSAEANRSEWPNSGLGTDYLTAAETATGDDADAGRAMAASIRAVLTGERDEAVVEYQRRISGAARWFVARIARLAGPGAPQAVITREEVTAQKMNSAALQTIEEQFRAVFERAAIGMDLVDPDGRFLKVNPAFCAMTGYSEQELLSGTVKDITHPDDMDADTEPFRRLLAGETTSYELEKRYVRKDGRIIWARLNVALVRDRDGKPLHVVGQIEDITARREAEEELHQSEERYRTLVEQLPAVVYVLANDAIQTPLYFSPQIEALTRETPEEALAYRAHWLELVHPDDRERVAAEDARAGNEGVFRAEYRHARKDGSYVWVRDECGPLRDVEGRTVAFQGVMLDISDRVRADAAEAEARTTGQFLGLVSHELRTPMQSVLGYAALLLGGHRGPLTPEQREDLHYVKLGAERVLALVEQMLDLAQLEAGTLRVQSEAVDVAAVVAAVRRETAPLAAAKGLALRVTAPAGLPPARADAARVHQVLRILVDNALKFTRAGQVSIAARATAEEIAVTVRDTGIGIPPGAVPDIFAAFRQGDGSTTRPHGGAGLGLAVARHLAELMGGRIAVESRSDEGAAFTLFLGRDRASRPA
jgi:two-component system, sensor histidine kinase and response regulator